MLDTVYAIPPACFSVVLSLMEGSTKARLKGKCGIFMEVKVAVALSRAWASADVQGDLELV